MRWAGQIVLQELEHVVASFSGIINLTNLSRFIGVAFFKSHVKAYCTTQSGSVVHNPSTYYKTSVYIYIYLGISFVCQGNLQGTANPTYVVCPAKPEEQRHAHSHN